MMIHDLDLLTMLVGGVPDDVQASAVAVLGEAEDVANVRMTYPPNAEGHCCVANVTASRLAMKTERTLRIISEEIYVSADFVERKVKVIRKAANAEQLADLRTRLAAGEDLSDVNYLELVQFEDLEVADAEPLRLQAEDFLQSVRTGEQPPVDAQAGSLAVTLAERIVQQARGGQLSLA
jgi:predicted dehydrogenase